MSMRTIVPLLPILFVLGAGAAGQEKSDKAEGNEACNQLLSKIRGARSLLIRTAWETRHQKSSCYVGNGSVTGSLNPEVSELEQTWKYEIERCATCGAAGSGSHTSVLQSFTPRADRDKAMVQFMVGAEPFLTIASRSIHRVQRTLTAADWERSDVRLAGRETFQGKETIVLEYVLTDRQNAARTVVHDVRLWLDATTSLPIQRTSTPRGVDLVIKEQFTTFRLNTEDPGAEKK
jgi:hypothetical protein